MYEALKVLFPDGFPAIVVSSEDDGLADDTRLPASSEKGKEPARRVRTFGGKTVCDPGLTRTSRDVSWAITPNANRH